MFALISGGRWSCSLPSIVIIALIQSWNGKMKVCGSVSSWMWERVEREGGIVGIWVQIQWYLHDIINLTLKSEKKLIYVSDAVVMPAATERDLNSLN